MDKMTQQPQMKAIKERHTHRQVIHTEYLVCCYCKQIQTLTIFHHSLGKMHSLSPSSQSHTQTKNIHLCRLHAELSFVLRSAVRAWPCVVRALWCASAGFHLPVPWQPLPALIKNIPWNFLTLPRPRHHFAHIHTLARMFMFVTQSPMICRYLSPKRAVTVKSPHVVLFVLESKPLWICLLKLIFMHMF